jgi:hypothetical protein
MKDYIYKIIYALTMGIIGWVTKTVVSLKKKNDATQKGVKALLRDRIVAVYELYMGKGYMPVYARENVQEMYKEYKNLKGNGVIDDLICKLYALPTEKKKKSTK